MESELPEGTGKGAKIVYIWDMDETIILLKPLLNGSCSYAGGFNGAKDVQEGIEIGNGDDGLLDKRRWRRVIEHLGWSVDGLSKLLDLMLIEGINLGCWLQQRQGTTEISDRQIARIKATS